MDGSFREGGRWREVRTRSRGCARIYARPLAVGIWEVKGAPSRSTKYIRKCEAKLQIPLEVILYGLKWKSVFFEKLQEFDVKMHQNGQKSVKTSELEDRYAVIFSLALWPEEPREIDFFKKSWFSQKWSSKQVKKQ